MPQPDTGQAIVWPELTLPTEEESLARARAYQSEFEGVLGRMIADQVDLTRMTDADIHPNQWLYQQSVYLAWLAHHRQRHTATDTFWLPYGAVTVEESALVLCHYEERDPQAQGTDWQEHMVLFHVNLAYAPVLGQRLTSGGDRVFGCCRAVVNTGTIFFISHDGSSYPLPRQTELANHRPESGGQTMTHLHPEPHLFHYYRQQQLPYSLTVNPRA